jgi:hypothetical protein
VTLHAALLALCLAAGVAALALARRDRRVRPVAWYLWVTGGLDVARLVREKLLPPATGIREGWELVGRSAEVGLYLASLMALAALARVVFVRQSIKPVIYAGAGMWAIIVATYPALRGDALLAVYDAVELGGLLVSLLYLYRWLFGAGRPLPSPATGCTHALIGASGATVALPWATGQTVLEAWPEIVAINACMMAAVLVQLLQALARSPRKARS